MELSPSNLSLILVSMSISVLLLIWQKWWSTRGTRLPPGPPAWPIIGNLLHLLSGGGGAAPHRSLAKLAQRYGPLVYLRLGSMPAVVASSPEVAREFLSTHDKVFASRPHMEGGRRMTYGEDGGVALRSYGGEWRELRRLYTQQLFVGRRLNEYKPMIMEEVRAMMGEIRGYAATGVAYDLTRGVGTLMENIICRILMGKRLAEVSSIKLGKNLKQVMQEGSQLFATPLIGDYIPWLSFLDVKTTRRMDAWHAAVDDLLENLLAAREKAPVVAAASPPHHDAPADHDEPLHQDFLHVLLSNHLPRLQVKAIILELMAAGIDTSSTSLDWAMSEILINQEVMDKLQEELERVVGDSPNRMFQEEDLHQLVYAKAILKESMRLHTPIPLLLPHMSMESCEIGKYSLPKGTRVLVNAWAMGHDAQLWDEVNRFWPERFLSKCQHVELQGKHFELVPFGSGRRICPGMPLALLIIEITLANLFHLFHWSLPPPPNNVVDMSEELGAFMYRAHPLMAIPHLRHPN